MIVAMLFSIVIAGILLAGAFQQAWFPENPRLTHRLDKLMRPGSAPTVGKRDSIGDKLARWMAGQVGERDLSLDPERRRLMLQAGFYGEWALRVYVASRLFAPLAAAVVFASLAFIARFSVANVIALAIGGAMIGQFFPSFYVGRRARLRQTELSKELSDVLDLLVVSVESGLGLQEAVRTVASHSSRHRRLIGTELTLAMNEMSTGASLSTALRNLAERVCSEDLRSLVAILVQSEKIGSPIAPALRAAAEALRNKRRLRAEEYAAKASIKMLFPLAFLVLPAMMMMVIGPALIQVIEVLRHA